ncbi:leucine--tRNA ligase [Haloplanus salilacus]|uniref:leucine--tRNA ligase n=1 Tax=Haloplanus salilacus TaxID=2949994 RepID=UPI0030D501EE
MNEGKHWQETWRDEELFELDDSATDPTYILGMFPFTTGELHIGHVRNYTITDTFARFKRMRGEDVLHPMGWDAFGLPTENAAQKNGIDPEIWTNQSVNRMRNQMENLGFSYDWSREIRTSDPGYYRWTQWLFKRFYEAGLVERKHGRVNWCPSDETVLANAEVQDGACWRCGTTVETRELTQWFFTITDYADELLDGLDELSGWPSQVKERQRNWIGRREGTKVTFELAEGGSVDVFTKRLDRIHGATYLALAPHHDRSLELATDDSAVAKYISSTGDDTDRGVDGVRTDATAIHPVTGEELPVYVSEYVLEDLGTGAVIGIPAHDERDFEFARAHDIESRRVVEPDRSEDGDDGPFTGDGTLVNSGEYDGLTSSEAQSRLHSDLEVAESYTDYRLRDWCISRQRYWGTPIPIVDCPDCGYVTVPDEDLPVELPEYVQTTGNPLEEVEDFVDTTCPECGADAVRETDTMDTFVDSSWYYLRFISPDEDEMPFDIDRANEWLPVDLYVGGQEHSVLHLLYMRFFARALSDIGLLDVREPVTTLLPHGYVLNHGKKMSKSDDNTISPAEYGEGLTRLFIMGGVKPQSDFDWSNHRRDASYTLRKEIAELGTTHINEVTDAGDRPVDEYVSRAVDHAIETITDHYESLEFYDAVRELRSLYSVLSQYREHTTPDADVFTRGVRALVAMIYPIMPHMCEEVWHYLDDTLLAASSWPEPERRTDDFELGQRTVSSVRSDIREICDSLQDMEPSEIRLVVSPEWKYRAMQVALDEDSRVYDKVVETVDDPDTADQLTEYAQYLAENRRELTEELPPDRERDTLERASWMIEMEFDATVSVVPASEADPTMRERAQPGKPAISIS